jgi:hypothetical protein
MHPAVQRIYALLHLDVVLPCHDELASALAALGVRDVAAPTPLVAAASVAPPPDLGLVAHASLAAAPSARQAPGPLVFVAGAADDRDATIRSEGWIEYLTLMEQTNEEAQA